MGLLSSLLVGAAMGIAGTWAYLRSRPGGESVDSGVQTASAVVEEAASDAVDAVVVEETAVAEESDEAVAQDEATEPEAA